MPKRSALMVSIAALGLVVAVPNAAAGGACYGNPDIKMSTSTDNIAAAGECAFYPTVIYIEPGERVTWFNKDPYPHTVTGATNSWGSERELLEGDKVSYAFKKEGVYPFYCAYHPSMVGAVVVGDGTQAAALSSTGFAAVDEIRADTASAERSAPVEPGASLATSILIAVGIVVTFGVAGVAWRTLSLRRRAASATPAP